MSVIETNLTTTIVDGLEQPFTVKILYSDKLDYGNVYQLARNSAATHGFLDYLFLVHALGQNLDKWYFGNARRHEEMLEAIKSNLNQQLEYTYAQLQLDTAKLDRTGELKYYSLRLNSQTPTEINSYIDSLINLIDPELLEKRLYLMFLGDDQRFTYNTAEKTLRKLR